MSPKDFSEAGLVEKPTLERLGQLGYEVAYGYTEQFGAEHVQRGGIGRDDQSQVVLRHRLRPKLTELNPDLPDAALDAALEELTRDRSAMDPTRANHEVWLLLRDGAKVTVADDEDTRVTETVAFVDWRTPANNAFLAVSQLWVVGPLHTRRTDIVCFVNGIPFVLLELKASHKSIEHAYRKNLRDYRDTVPSSSSPTRSCSSRTARRRGSGRPSRRGNASASGSGSTTRPKQASSRWRQRSTDCVSRRDCWTWPRTSSPTWSARAG